MLLIMLDRKPVNCRVELDGQDISQRITRIEIDADVNGDATYVTLTLSDDVSVVGEAGKLEFVKNTPEGQSN